MPSRAVHLLAIFVSPDANGDVVGDCLDYPFLASPIHFLIAFALS